LQNGKSFDGSKLLGNSSTVEHRTLTLIYCFSSFTIVPGSINFIGISSYLPTLQSLDKGTNVGTRLIVLFDCGASSIRCSATKFPSTPVSNTEIVGDYLAGVEPESVTRNRKGAGCDTSVYVGLYGLFHRGGGELRTLTRSRDFRFSPKSEHSVAAH
jgi:hypothetical protein